jgi:hypothetical protein
VENRQSISLILHRISLIDRYVTLGFEKVLDGDFAVFRVGSSGFISAAFDQAENFMMQLVVDDLDVCGCTYRI